MIIYTIKKQKWYSLTEIKVIYPIINSFCFDEDLIFTNKVPKEFKKSFKKIKKGYIEDTYGICYINSNWFNTNIISIIESLETWHNDQLLELNIPLIKTLKELDKVTNITEIKVLSQMNIDAIKLYIELKWLSKDKWFASYLGDLEIEYEIQLAMTVAEWMQDDIFIKDIYDNISYRTLMFFVPVKGTTLSVRYKWYEQMLIHLENYVVEQYTDWRYTEIRNTLQKEEYNEMLEYIIKKTKEFKDNIDELLNKYIVDSETESKVESGTESESGSDM